MIGFWKSFASASNITHVNILKMKDRKNKTKCQLCGSAFSASGISRHLTSCLEKTLQNHPRDANASYLHLHIKGFHLPEYFLHLLVSEKIRLKELDRYLRDLWLECCGHMSAFRVLNTRVELDMHKKLIDAFFHSSHLHYEYDFGDTTSLLITNKGSYTGCTDLAGPIVLLSRNPMPVFDCDACGNKTATMLCLQCQWDSEGLLCPECTERHECDSEDIVPITNSPRLGVCGYVGEDEMTDEPVFIDQASVRTTEHARKAKKKPVDAIELKNRLQALEEMLLFFYRKYENRDLQNIALDLLHQVENNEALNLHRGKLEIWAAAIVYAIARINDQFHVYHPVHISAGSICEHFKVKQTTVAAKAKQIEVACGLEWEDEIDEFELFGFGAEDIFDDASDGPLPGDISMPNLEALLSDPSLDWNLLKSQLAEAIKKDYESILPGNISLDGIPMIEQLVDDIAEHILDSLEANGTGLDGIWENKPPDLLKITGEQTLAKQKKKEENEQQKFADTEKRMIDKGQLTIFDDD